MDEKYEIYGGLDPAFARDVAKALFWEMFDETEIGPIRERGEAITECVLAATPNNPATLTQSTADEAIAIALKRVAKLSHEVRDLVAQAVHPADYREVASRLREIRTFVDGSVAIADALGKG